MKLLKLRWTNYQFITIYFFSLSIQFCFGQNYDFKKYLLDSKIEGKMYSFRKSNEFDSIKFYLTKYKNRLGYNYYYNKAILASIESSALQKNYLDSAFRRGLGIKCMGEDLRLFDRQTAMISFEENFIKDYDENYRNELQKMEDLDQKYRPAIGEYMNYLRKNSKYDVLNSDSIHYIAEQNRTVRIIDSLKRAQGKLDSLNFLKWQELNSQKGWPSAKLVGITECFYSRVPSPSVLVMHIGVENEYLVDLLTNVLSLCIKNEDSWRNAESLIFFLYNSNRLTRNFSKFWFLELENKRVDEFKSYFANYKMAELLIKNPNEIIEIKCRDEVLFYDLKKCLLNASSQIQVSELKKYTEQDRKSPESLSESRIQFVKDRRIKKDQVFFRFIVK